MATHSTTGPVSARSTSRATLGVVLLLASLAACSQPRPPLRTATRHLFDDAAAWQVVRPAGPVVAPEVRERLAALLRPDHEIDGPEDTVHVASEYTATGRWQPHPEPSGGAGAVVWHCRPSHGLAWPGIVVAHARFELRRVPEADGDLPPYSYRDHDGGVLLALPADAGKPEGFHIAYRTFAVEVLSQIQDVVGDPSAAPRLREITLSLQTRQCALVPPPMALRRTVKVPRGGRLLLSLGLERLGPALEGESLRLGPSRSDGAGVRVAIRSNGASEIVLDEALAPAQAGKFHDRAVDLARWSGQNVELEIATYGGRTPEGEVDAAPARALHDFLFVAEPILAAAHEPESSPPNVLLVVLDTLRADALGCYGGTLVETPTLDRLAREGWLFEQARSSCSWTLPSHVSLFSSLLPVQHGILDREQKLPSSVVTVAEALRAAGWITLAATGGSFVSPQHNLGQGFDRFDVPGEVEACVARMLSWIEAIDAPFFAFVHTYQVHTPYAPPEEFRSRVVPEYRGALPKEVDYWDLEKLASEQGAPTADDVAYVRALYHAEVAYTDSVLAKLLAALRSRESTKDTLVIVTSDHGEEFWEHGDHSHFHSLYDEVLRIPLLVHHPRAFAGGRRIAAPVRIEDIAPTIAGFAGVPRPPQWVGVPLDQPDAHRDIVSALRLGRGQGHVSAVARVADGTKWIEAPVGFYRNARQVGCELFDLQSDPGERSPQAEARHAPHAAALARLLERYPRSVDEERGVQLDEDEIEKLRSLGYVK